MRFPKIFWSHLAKLNAARLINTMYVWIFLVPILAKLLESVGGEVQLNIFEHTFLINLELPFSWIAFYFSALSFALANILFQLKCPSVIKEQQNYFEFRRANRGVEHIDAYLPEIGMNWEGLRQHLEHKDKYLMEVAEVLNPKSNDNYLRKRFWAVYDHGNSASPGWRFSVTTLYALGGVLISIVLGQNAIFVTRHLLGW